MSDFAEMVEQVRKIQKAEHDQFIRTTRLLAVIIAVCVAFLILLQFVVEPWLIARMGQ